MHTDRSTILTGYLLSACSALLLVAVAVLAARGVVEASMPWLPGLGISFSFRLDGFAQLFAYMVTGIGALVLAYAGHYLGDSPSAGRFLVTLFAFLLAMLGVVLADDLFVVLFFWELTSITSFLLIGHTRTDQARRGALQSLAVTGLGGVCLLAGVVLIKVSTGISSLSALMESGELLRSSGFYPVILGLVAVGCLAKSAQFPLHFWLPDSMAAPTPASAFLHSATMVKAGIYLLFRFEPVLGGTTEWRTILCLTGGMTLILGSWKGLRQNDLKALLAYSTLAQLGALTMLLGVGGPEARSAVVLGIVAHASYKSSLFLSVGIIDHSAGTRDLSKLGGMASQMPGTAMVALGAGVSMAGIPITAGFVGKEGFLAGLEGLGGGVFVAAAGVAGVCAAFLVAQAAKFWFSTFAGEVRHEPDAHPHDPHPVMLGAAAVPAVAGLVLPLLTFVTPFLSRAAGSKASFYPFHGLTWELGVSAGALALGVVFYTFRAGLIAIPSYVGPSGVCKYLFDHLVATVDRLAWFATRAQTGDIRLYLSVMILAVLGIFLHVGHVPFPNRIPSLLPGTGSLAPDLALTLLHLFTLLLVTASSVASVFIRRDLFAILALGASGVAMALLFALEPAPDVALVMVVVDILTVVVMMLALTKLPPARRREAGQADGVSRWKYFHGVVAGLVGVVVTMLAFEMLESRPRESVVSPFYFENALPGTGADDIVGSIVVDFRGFDTLIEITVFSLAGLGVYTLLRYASRYAGDQFPPTEVVEFPVLPPSIKGVGAPETSSFARALAYILLPLCFVISVVHMMYGHHQPGDGFTAGVIASLGISFYFVILGYRQARKTLRWLTPTTCIGAGLIVALVAQTLSGLLGGTGAFFAPLDFGEYLGITRFMPYGFNLSNSFFFEIAIFLTVLGSACHMIDSLGHPSSDRSLTSGEDDDFSLDERASIPVLLPAEYAPAEVEVPDVREDVVPEPMSVRGREEHP